MSAPDDPRPEPGPRPEPPSAWADPVSAWRVPATTAAPPAGGPLPPGPPPAPPRRGLAALPAPSAPRTHRWGLPAFLLAEAVFLVASVVVGVALLGESLRPGGPPLDVWAFVVATAVPTLLAAAVALLATRLRGNGPRADLGLGWSAHDVLIGLGLGFAGLVVSTVAAVVWIAVVGEDVGSALGDTLDGLRAPWPVALAVLVTVVVVAPIGEEILFRGLLWGAVEKLGAGPWLAFGITTVVFAFAHFEPLRAPLLLVIALPIGLARLITGRLVASVVAHAVNNLLPGIALYLMLVGVQLPAPA